jgi:hypothetical protein
MRLLPVLITACGLLAGCGDEEPPDKTEGLEPTTHTLGSTWTPEGTTDEASDSGESGSDETDGECAEEGEACEITEDGWHNCCLGRHTCFPEGCYYTEP